MKTFKSKETIINESHIGYVYWDVMDDGNIIEKTITYVTIKNGYHNNKNTGLMDFSNYQYKFKSELKYYDSSNSLDYLKNKDVFISLDEAKKQSLINYEKDNHIEIKGVRLKRTDYTKNIVIEDDSKKLIRIHYRDSICSISLNSRSKYVDFYLTKETSLFELIKQIGYKETCPIKPTDLFVEI